MKRPRLDADLTGLSPAERRAWWAEHGDAWWAWSHYRWVRELGTLERPPPGDWTWTETAGWVRSRPPKPPPKRRRQQRQANGMFSESE